MPRKLTPDEAIVSAEIDARIIRMRRDGEHFADIAAAVGLAVSTVHNRFKRWTDAIPESEARMWRVEEVTLLDANIKGLLADLEDPASTPRTRVEIRKEIRFHSESRRKITGIDAPVKREYEILDSGSGDAQLQAEIEEMQREQRAADLLGGTE
jgi:methylphosphotriester-DNA--protein-cysteine methyltransferase